MLRWAKWDIIGRCQWGEEESLSTEKVGARAEVKRRLGVRCREDKAGCCSGRKGSSSWGKQQAEYEIIISKS